MSYYFGTLCIKGLKDDFSLRADPSLFTLITPVLLIPDLKFHRTKACGGDQQPWIYQVLLREAPNLINSPSNSIRRNCQKIAFDREDLEACRKSEKSNTSQGDQQSYYSQAFQRLD